MKSNLTIVKSCLNCKHCLHRPLGKDSFSIKAIMSRVDDTKVACYCNIEHDCPCTNDKDFTEACNKTYDPLNPGALRLWFKFPHEPNERHGPEVSPRFCGYGEFVCNEWEERDNETCEK